MGAAGSLHSVSEHLSLLGPGMLANVVFELLWWRLEMVEVMCGGGWGISEEEERRFLRWNVVRDLKGVV